MAGNILRAIAIALSLGMAAAPPFALAHDNRHRAKQAVEEAAEQREFGIAGNPKQATRTIRIVMSDRMRFAPASIAVKQGDTVRFVIVNDGKLMHEMVIGTMRELEEHAALMRKFPDMEHDEPHMAHVRPGTTEELVWRFNRPGQFNFACLIAGHFEAGMVGAIKVLD
ncbi:MAG TPA: cupredoxin family protein [Paucimonas sp.]|nr:cupredoxin family protein [Paucimonas sp.]